MNLKQISNTELEISFGKLVQTERKITSLVLKYIIELEARKLYLEKSYTSLFAFLVQGYGYSPAAAWRRISSAGLVKDSPELLSKVENGALNLSQLAEVQKVARAVQKTENRKVSICEKLHVLKKMEFASQETTELILAQEFSLPIMNHEKQKIHRDESVTLTMSFSKDEIRVLESLKDLASHSVPENSWSALFMYLAQKELEARSPREKKSRARTFGKESQHSINNWVKVKNIEIQNTEMQNTEMQNMETHNTDVQSADVQNTERRVKSEPLKTILLYEGTRLNRKAPSKSPADSKNPTHSKNREGQNKDGLSPQAVLKSQCELKGSGNFIGNPTGPHQVMPHHCSTLRKPIKTSIRKSLIHSRTFCEQKDLQTGKVCGATRFLQIDHIQPVWAGGSNHKSNLQVLCASHNRHRYSKQAGLTLADLFRSGNSAK